MMHARWGDYYMIDKTYSNCGKEMPYMYLWETRQVPWIKNFYLFTYIGISQRAKYNYPYLCPILHQFLISKAVCSKNSDRRNQMALEFFQHSWKNLLASTPRKSWGVTKKILSASAISFQIISFLLCFNSSGRNFVSGTDGCEILYEF